SVNPGEYEGSRPIGHYILLALLVQSLLAGVVLVLFPLYVFKRRALTIPRPFGAAGYFGGVGLAFIFVGIGLMQKFVLYLGHPTYALSVVLFAILVFSGLGSLYAGGRNPSRALRTALPLIPALLVVFLALFGPLVSVTLGAPLTTRIAVAILV